MSWQLKYIAKRLLYAFITIFVLVTITFVLMQLLPGSPFSGQKVLTPEIEAALNAKYGLDKPMMEQFVIYLSNLVQGDLGTSLISGRPVTTIIAQAFPVSFELGIRSLIFAITIGFMVGIIAALKRGTKWDTLTMIVVLLGVSIPSFIMGALLQYLFGVVLFQVTGVKVFAVMGWGAENTKILPSFALSFSTIAVIGRLMRSSLVDVLQQDYIKTAKIKGLTKKEIVLHHGIRNAILPVVTILGPITAVLLTGTFAIEHIFSIPGLGRYFVDSIQAYDYPVIVGVTLFFGTFLVLCNLLVDILNSFLDPRLKLGGQEDGRK